MGPCKPHSSRDQETGPVYAPGFGKAGKARCDIAFHPLK